MARAKTAAKKRATPKRAASRKRAATGKASGRRTSRPRRAATSAVETVDITPRPKILKVLGNIEFEPWQCIAELADNAFDEFLEIKRSSGSWNEPFQVTISLPAGFSLDEPGVVVSDNGRGMTLQEVTDAAKAGWTANDPLSKLGLFGMGFNVATARLGNVTRILTSRAGDPDWVGLEIDLKKITHDFKVPVVRVPKATRREHGTRVEIRQLEQRAEWFQRSTNVRKLRDILGGIYGYLLDTESFRLSVNDVEVKPIRFCVWDESRSVTRGKEVIPAVIPIDHPLADQAVCLTCGIWQDPANKRCDECDAKTLEIRERRVWGWVGIQRYLHTSEFGIDFLRNGRKILRWDKGLFRWRDPDDPSGHGEPEYPIDLPHQGGRIVGEIHIDHVPVHYLKNQFDTNATGWRKAVELIRGKGPLLPQRAKELGYSQNNSPLAKLHRGYRRNEPGQRYLMPGNGKAILDTRDWGKKFQQGNTEYQDDSKWWEAVERHEELAEEERRAKEERERRAAEGLEDPTTEFQTDTPTAEEPAGTEGDGQPEEALTEAQRVERLLAIAHPMAELDGQFSVSGVAGKPVKMSAFQTVRGPIGTGDGERTPVWLAPRRGGSFAAFVDLSHPHFASFDDDPADMVLMELAQHLIARAQGAAPPISAVYAALKDRYLTSRVIEQSRLVAEAAQTMRELQERMPPCVLTNPERPWQNALNEAERFITNDRIVEVLKTTDLDAVLNDGRYLLYVPSSVVPRIVEEWPDAFFDGHLFRAPYEEVSSATAKRQTVASITGYLNDIAWLAGAPPAWSREQLIRARLSLQLLPDELVPTEE